VGFTNPAHHDPANYRYFINAITPVGDDENNPVKKADSLGRMDNLEIYAKLPISTSIVDHTHGETWSQLGFILSVPKECVYCASPHDLGNQITSEYHGDWTTAWYNFYGRHVEQKAKEASFKSSLAAQFTNAVKWQCRQEKTLITPTLDQAKCEVDDKDKLFPPADILTHSDASQGFNNRKHNEIFVLGTDLTNKKSVHVTAGWVKGCFKAAKWTTPDVPQAYMDKMVAVLHKAGLPLIHLPCVGTHCNC